MTKLLLHFDGANNSTVFSDETGKAVATNGSPKISTAQSKFGGSSGLFNQNGATFDYLVIADSPDFNFGSEDFTVETWFYTSVASGFQVLADKRTTPPSGRSWVFYLSDTVCRFSASFEGSAWGVELLTAAGAFTVNTWNHMAVTRSGSEWRLFVNGVLLHSLTVSGSIYGVPDALRIGNSYHATNPQTFYGHIDELRIIKGSAAYTANFTPATAPFALPPSPNRPRWFSVTRG